MKILALALALFSASPSPVDTLMAASAADFQAHQPHLADVRDVHTGTLTVPGEAPQPIICGQFRMGGTGGDTWSDFAAIKTSGYEQWLGETATAYCRRADMDHGKDHDLTDAYKAQLGVK